MSSSSSGPPLPTLIVTGGASDGLEVLLEAPGVEKTIGSAAHAQVRLTSRNVDGVHARVSWEDATVVLTDESSAAGTFVNGERVGSGHVLQDGDRISIGPPGSPESVRLLVRVPADLAAAADVRIGLAGDSSPALAAPSDDALLFEDAVPAPPPEPEAFVFEEASSSSPKAEAAPAVAAAAPPSPRAPSAPLPPYMPPAPVAPEATPRAARGGTPAGRPDYMTEMPSIGGDRVREVPAFDAPAPRPATPARPKVRGPAIGSVPRLAVAGVAAAALTAAGFYAYSHLHRPPPVLSGILPPKAEAGGTVTISGSGFEASAGDNTVRFGDAVGTVTNGSATSLTVTVPAIPSQATKEVPVTVRGHGGSSNALFVKIARLPRIVRLEPEVAVPGTEITLHGQNLDGGPATVRIGSEKVEARDVRADSLRARVPDMSWTDGQSVSVVVEIGADTARAMPLLMGRLPLVLDVAPSSGAVGERIAIKGRGFDPTPYANHVTIGGASALVLAATPSELSVAVPNAPTPASQAGLPVVVESHGTSSSGQSTFSLSHPLSGMIRLHFFPAPAPVPAGASADAPDRHALVSTELGPLLLLTGKADATSTAERAARAADAMAAVTEAAANRPPTFEVRDGASPAVAVTGGPVVVTATSDDADGYAQPWEAGTKPARSTPKQIAAYWAALLQDYVVLFAEGQRPSRTAELSPRGKVLVDLFSEAQRRGATGGVPISTVYDLSPAALKSVREMALLLPAGGGSSAGLAVAGHWEGTMADAEAERSIEVQLQFESGHLEGSLTSKSGALAVRTPLQQITYDKGLLKFVTVSGGASRQFRATLDGSTLAGSIFKDAASKDKDAVGRFSLRYVD
jgi:FHA domain-containing protein/IPT/TIG domain-containing protein